MFANFYNKSYVKRILHPPFLIRSYSTENDKKNQKCFFASVCHINIEGLTFCQKGCKNGKGNEKYDESFI